MDRFSEYREKILQLNPFWTKEQLEKMTNEQVEQIYTELLRIDKGRIYGSAGL